MGNIIITYLPVLHRENQFFHSVLTCLQPWSCYWGSPNTLDVTENPMFKVDNYYSHCRGITLTVHSTLKLIYSVWVHKNIMQSVKHFVKQFTAINYFNNSQFLLDHSMTLQDLSNSHVHLSPMQPAQSCCHPWSRAPHVALE